jgi:hypothetical protein
MEVNMLMKQEIVDIDEEEGQRLMARAETAMAMLQDADGITIQLAYDKDRKRFTALLCAAKDFRDLKSGLTYVNSTPVFQLMEITDNFPLAKMPGSELMSLGQEVISGAEFMGEREIPEEVKDSLDAMEARAEGKIQ